VGVAQLDHDQTFLQSLSPAERNDLLNAARFFREKEDDGTGGTRGRRPMRTRVLYWPAPSWRLLPRMSAAGR
jgi:hypothetical protein